MLHGTWNLQGNFILGIQFDTQTAGTIDATVDTEQIPDLGVWIVRRPCDINTFYSAPSSTNCPWVAFVEHTTGRPIKLGAAGQAAGSFYLILWNRGGAKAVVCDVGITP